MRQAYTDIERIARGKVDGAIVGVYAGAMNPMTDRSRAVLIRLPEEPHRKLKVLAAQRGISVQAFMERLIDDAIAREEREHGEVRVIDDSEEG